MGHSPTLEVVRAVAVVSFSFSCTSTLIRASAAASGSNKTLAIEHGLLPFHNHQQAVYRLFLNKAMKSSYIHQHHTKSNICLSKNAYEPIFSPYFTKACLMLPGYADHPSVQTRRACSAFPQRRTCCKSRSASARSRVKEAAPTSQRRVGTIIARPI